MRTLQTLILTLILIPWLLSVPAGAQSSRPAATTSLAQAERNSVDLKQGMTLEEVQTLLGKPKRTALRNSGNTPSQPWAGTLQWTYSWSGASSSSRNLQVVFAAKAPEQWYVNSWDWTDY